MKKPLAHTKCTVKLRKSEYHNEWYLIVESYPVFNSPGSKPARIKEALNRSIPLLYGIRAVMHGLHQTEL